jgi:hypothetical protein
VVALTGDGGFNMVLGELETARRLGLAVTIIVVNNAASGYVKALQHLMYGEGAYQSSDLAETDYAAGRRGAGLPRASGSSSRASSRRAAQALANPAADGARRGRDPRSGQDAARPPTAAPCRSRRATALPEPRPADSVTRARARRGGRGVVTGSHGGVYAACLARRPAAARRSSTMPGSGSTRRHRRAGLARRGARMAAAAIDHRSADIGNAAQMLERGSVSHANRPRPRWGSIRAWPAPRPRMLLAAGIPQGPVEPMAESRRVLEPEGARRRLVLVDSAALVEPEDAGQVVVTGSHGALFGGDPKNALKVDAALALFNDAGGGAGTTRLPALQAEASRRPPSRGLGPHRRCAFDWQDGVISACNDAAAALGGKPGTPARELVARALYSWRFRG